jgi:ribonuclease III
MIKKEIFELDQCLGYRFKNPSLREESLRHSSWINEQNDKNLKNNERLEFLGDAVLNLAIGHMLMLRYPDINEGSLSRMRSSMVNESQLAEIAKTIDLGKHICLGKGEVQSNGFEKPSILADALEALIAAIYLDGGYDAVFEMIQGLFKSPINAMDKANIIPDYKTRLQELIQLRQIQMPQYATVKETGPDHEKTFVVELTAGAITVEGRGKSKKTAEQDAAKNAFQILEKECRQN